MAAGAASLSLKTLSITESSVEVVSIPQKDTQSFTTIPAAITSLPLFTVPAYIFYFNNKYLNFYFFRYKNYLTASGTCNKDDNSSWSCMDVFGWTNPPWFDNTEYDPTKTLLATVCLNTSTFNVSAKISSVSCRIISIINIAIGGQA